MIIKKLLQNSYIKDEYCEAIINCNVLQNIIQFNKNNNECNNTKRVHPTQKPLALMEYLIKTYTNENELVLDFTCGSFTTAIACLNTKRDFIGIELDDYYFEVGTKRVNEHLKTLDYTPEICYNV